MRGTPPEPNQDKQPIDTLIVELQAELRRIAAWRMARERPDHTLQPTALVNEAFLRLIDQSNLTAATPAQFLAAASNIMRRVLVDHARAKGAKDRGGGGEWQRISISGFDPAQPDAAQYDVLDLDEALDALKAQKPRLEHIVECFYFSGMTVAEIAEAIGMSEATVNKDLAFARLWLKARMKR